MRGQRPRGRRGLYVPVASCRSWGALTASPTISSGSDSPGVEAPLAGRQRGLTLERAAPSQYDLLIRFGALACVVAYSIVLGDLVLAHGAAVLLRRQETYTLGLAGVSLFLCHKGRLEGAALLLLVAVTLEVTISFALSGLGLKTSSLGEVPVVILAAGLFLGARAALTFGFLLPCLATLAAWAGGRWWGGPEIDGSDAFYLIALWVGGIVTGALLHVFLRSFEQVLFSAQLNGQRVSDLFRSAPDGLIVCGSDGAVESANDRAMSLLALNPTSLAGLHLGSIPLRYEGQSIDFESLGVSKPIEVVAAPTGVPLELLLQPITSRIGQRGQLLVLRDITDRKSAEIRQADLSAQLLHSQKLEAVGRLAGGVAHDFNNILTVVAGYADVLATFEDDTAKVIAEELKSTYERGANLTRQLLAFARRDVVRPRPIDVSQVVKGTQRLITRLAGERIEVKFETMPCCHIVADPGQLEQVVMNLASNATDAMPKGGTLSVETSSEGTSVRLTVTDSGVGIPDSVREKIFEPFFTTKGRGKGTGLGLATVHGIVAETKGTIRLDSTPGGGTRMQITWPRSMQEPQHTDEQSAPLHSRPFSGTILVAEDDEQTRTFIAWALSDHGFEVTAMTRGSEALEKIREQATPPDLLIADVVMPTMSGPELASRVRSDFPSVPVLFISGYTDDQLSPDVLDERTDFLRKPFGQKELIDRVVTMLGAE